MVAGGFDGLLRVVVRNEPCVVMEGYIPLPPETVEHGQQARVFFC